MTQDEFYMLRAITLAKKGAGHVSPNPMVGCVIVKNGRILAGGYHEKFGGPHAEVNALRKSKNRARGATMYATLEPCFHEGKTPPCVDAVIASQIRRVVIAMKDPNPLTSGKSIRRLKAHGISVNVGVCEKEAKTLNRFFIKHVTTGLPYVIAKVAQSLDGKIAAGKGEQTWLTGKKARAYVQDLRKTVDAVLVGRRTVEIDRPGLNVRKKGAPQPVRVVLDSTGQLCRKKKIFSKEGGPIILVVKNTGGFLKNVLRQRPVIFVLPCRRGPQGPISLKDLLKKLGRLGVSSVLVEGGAQVFTSFFKERLVDEWQFLIAPKRLGVQAVPAFSGDRGPDLRQAKISRLGQDILKVIL